MHVNGKCLVDLLLERPIHSLLLSHCGAITDVAFYLTPPPSLPGAPISSRCLIGDKRPGQCRPHHGRPAFAHHANNCQALGPSPFFCHVVIDSSLLTRFMGVGTFLPVTSNWSVVPLAAGPGPWLGQPKDKDASLMNYPQWRRTLPLKFFSSFFLFLSFFFFFFS